VPLIARVAFVYMEHIYHAHAPVREEYAPNMITL